MSNFYTWPGTAFPFRLYVNTPACRIFIIHNLTHNYDWLKEVKEKIKPTDFFFVTIAWYLDEHLLKQANEMFKELNLNPAQFFIMYNDIEEQINGFNHGLDGEIINHNAWLDENIFYIEEGVEKTYDALYIARRSEMKRHHLCESIENLALVAGGANHKNKICEIPECKNNPSEILDASGVRKIINQSKTGLCLSQKEGACWSSGEYLLCGTPVVSTQNFGGRSTFYNLNNSLISDDNKISVAQAVDNLIKKNFNPEDIRKDHIRKQTYFRKIFKKNLYYVLKSRGVELNVDEYFKDNFIDKMYHGVTFESVIDFFKNA
tara:strand:+ start:955 stop:1911 length:957 start_codon:yes stop_codon:yes gene_type:complete